MHPATQIKLEQNRWSLIRALYLTQTLTLTRALSLQAVLRSGPEMEGIRPKTSDGVSIDSDGDEAG